MSWQNIKALREQRAKSFADAAQLRDLAHTENRDLTAEQQLRHGVLIAEVENFSARIDREEKAAALGETIQNRSAPGRDDPTKPAPTSTGVPEKDMAKYSITRAINSRINGTALDGLEAEVSKEIALRSGKPAQGFYVPLDIGVGSNKFQNRALDTTQGAGAIPTILATTFIEALRNRIQTVALGATLMANVSCELNQSTGQLDVVAFPNFRNDYKGFGVA